MKTGREGGYKEMKKVMNEWRKVEE